MNTDELAATHSKGKSHKHNFESKNSDSKEYIYVM